MTGLACSHTGNLGLEMHIQWIAHVPGHIPGPSLSPELHILLIDGKWLWTSNHPTWIADGSQLLGWCPWFRSTALVFNMNFQKLIMSGENSLLDSGISGELARERHQWNVWMRLWSAAGGFAVRDVLVFSVLLSRNLNSFFPPVLLIPRRTCNFQV